MKRKFAPRVLAAMLSYWMLASPLSVFAWGNDGHRLINRLAVASLPADMPAFLRTQTSLDEVEYLGPEPDRWRSPAEPELNAAQAPEHFLDLELADMLGALPPNRMDFETLAITHGLRPDKVGLQPWQTDEVWQRLKAAFRQYRALSAAHQNTGAVEQAILFYIGWLGHYVGDGSQPLHTTINYDGWVLKSNPHHFSGEHGIHSRFESAFVGPGGANFQAADVAPDMTPLKRIAGDMPGDMFAAYMRYLRQTSRHIDEVYSLDQAGGFDGKGTPASCSFTEERLAAGASMLRDMIYTAWVQSAEPVPQRH